MENNGNKYVKKVQAVKDSLKDYPNIKIVAASKYMTVEETRELVLAGIDEIGENRTDMFLEKYEAMKDLNVKWHFFGTVQSRKIKDVVNKIDCLHSLCKLPTAMELDSRLDKTLDCYVQVNISEEPNKSGVAPAKVKAFIKQLSMCKNIRVIGLMCIAKMTFDDEVLISEFSRMQKLQKEIEDLQLDYAPCHELSMGMSNDYLIAVKYGSTCVRLGHIFME
ncbi:MAG: YggS family pyridoxal phosphate-dependent enzyme [Bacilli bacterium]|nr:YggS family pyridoxal phosphate-dependent enzyme [Bacilli bacterium]